MKETFNPEDAINEQENAPQAEKKFAKGKNIYQKLFAVQQSLKAHKGHRNDFGKYNYRSAEDILEAVKPLLAEQEAIILVDDEIVNIGVDGMQVASSDNKTSPINYIKATVRFINIEDGQEVTAHALARECQHTGMSADQCTGCASSYARKYALNALLCIDNTADSDSNEVAEIEKKAREAQQGGNVQQMPQKSNSGTGKAWGSKSTATQPAQQTTQQSAPQTRSWGSKKAN